MSNIQNTPNNYTQDPNTSKPDSRLSTFIKGMTQLQQIYSVEPLEYTDIVGEYWQRINDIIFSLGLTETQDVITNIGWTVTTIGKQRSSLITEELGKINTRNYEIINPAVPENNFCVGGAGTGKERGAHKYGLIQSIDWLFQRNINTWGDLYDYFYNNLTKEPPVHPS